MEAASAAIQGTLVEVIPYGPWGTYGTRLELSFLENGKLYTVLFETPLFVWNYGGWVTNSKIELDLPEQYTLTYNSDDIKNMHSVQVTNYNSLAPWIPGKIVDISKSL
jgi:hypothetical protein